jgi:hypothetical protein
LNKWIFGIIFLISFSVLFSSQDAFAVLLFQDDFSLDPMDNGWTEEIRLGGPSDDISPIVVPNIPPHIDPDGTKHGTEVFFKIGDNTAAVRFFNIKQIISTECFENIKIRLTAHQLEGNYEPADFLEISVDTNGDGTFESVLKDVDVWDAVDDPDDDSPNRGTTSPLRTDFIPLPNAATNNPNLNIKIEASFNSRSIPAPIPLEGYFLTEVEVTGDAIQGICDAVGGNILEIDNYALFVAAIGTNPVITGLVGITLAGIAGQALWFVHRRKNS